MPDVVYIYCFIVFPEAKDSPFFTLFDTGLKPTTRSELTLLPTVDPSWYLVPVLSPCANTASFHLLGTRSDERVGRSMPEVIDSVGCIYFLYILN